MTFGRLCETTFGLFLCFAFAFTFVLAFTFAFSGVKGAEIAAESP